MRSVVYKRCYKNAEHLFDICWYAIQMYILRNHLYIALEQAKLPDIPSRHRAWKDRLGGVAPLVKRDQLHGELGKTPGEIGMLRLDNQSRRSV